MKSCLCIDMDRARKYYAKQNKSEKEKYHMISLMWNLGNKRDEHGGREERKTKKQS